MGLPSRLPMIELRLSINIKRELGHQQTAAMLAAGKQKRDSVFLNHSKSLKPNHGADPTGGRAAGGEIKTLNRICNLGMTIAVGEAWPSRKIALTTSNQAYRQPCSGKIGSILA